MKHLIVSSLAFGLIVACDDQIPIVDPVTRADVTTTVRGVEFARFEGGDFTMGRVGVDFAEPLVEVTVEPFDIMRTEVTTGLYRTCVAEGGCLRPGFDNDSRCTYSAEAVPTDDHPINCVTWDEVQAFIAWFGHGTRLPSEAEWEFAAGGGLGYPTPWGTFENDCEHMSRYQSSRVDAADDSLCVSLINSTSTVPVCSRPLGNTPEPHALCDMAGSMTEIIADTWHPALDCSTWVPPDPSQNWPCLDGRVPADGTPWMDPEPTVYYMVKGSSFGPDPEIARRSPWDVEIPASYDAGFRLVRDAR